MWKRTRKQMAKRIWEFCKGSLFQETEHDEKWKFWWRKGQDKGRHFEFGSNLRRCREWSEDQVCGLYRVEAMDSIGIQRHEAWYSLAGRDLEVQKEKSWKEWKLGGGLSGKLLQWVRSSNRRWVWRREREEPSLFQQDGDGVSLQSRYVGECGVGK